MSLQQSETHQDRVREITSDKAPLLSRRGARARTFQARLHAQVAEAHRLGVDVKTKVVIDKSWTDAEDETVRRLYPDYAGMVDVMRHRSYSALRNRADKLGLRAKRHVWTNAEQARLKAMWAGASAAELRAAFPAVSYAAIVRAGERQGLPRRGTPPLAPTGNWLCDAIRDRCRVLGYTMRDLDRMADTGAYFSTCQWRANGGHSWKPMMAAAKMLGGELRVEWPD